MKKEKKDRVIEVVNILKKLIELKLSLEMQEIQEFQKILKQWVLDGIYKEGEIDIHNSNRRIEYKLYNRKDKEILVKLAIKK